MKVALEKSFPMPASVEAVWTFLRNIEAVAACMPGATISEQLDPRRYKGTIGVRLGPASMTFKGEIEVRELDETERTLRLIGKGADSSGTSGASMDLTVRAESGDTPEVSRIVGKSELSMSGKAASFGGRMMGSVADQILKQFAENFAREVRVIGMKAPDASGVTPPDPQVASASSPPMPAENEEPVHSGSTGTSAPEHSSAAPRELNAIALLWAAVRGWIRNVLRRNPA